MTENWKLLYKEMMNAIEECWHLNIPKSQQIKNAYKIATDYLHRLESQLKNTLLTTMKMSFFFIKM